MTDFIAASFAKQINELEEVIRAQWTWPSPEAGFALHLYSTTAEPGPLPGVQQCAWPDVNTLRHPQQLAAAGYILAIDSSVATSSQLSEWAVALDHLTKKDPFPLDRQSFAHRPMELLGIANGAAKCSVVTEQTLEELRNIVCRLPASGNRDPWSTGLYGLAAHLLGVSWVSTLSPPFEPLPIDTLAMLKWMTVAHPSASVVQSAMENGNQLDLALLKAIATGFSNARELGSSAVVHYALRRAVSERVQSAVEQTWQVNRASRDALALVEQLCRRFPLFARQLQNRRRDVSTPDSKDKSERPTIEMKDEYDVQDAMHAILRLHFDDVRNEEWTPSYGGSHTRMDFLLKHERIVIETKMTRRNLSQVDLVDQLVIDKEHYRQHPDCQTLVCFVYDPESRCNNPAAVEGDLGSSVDEFRVIVIVSPRLT